MIYLGRKNKDRATATWLIFYVPAIACILIGLIGSPALYRANAGENASTLTEVNLSNKGAKTYFTVEHPGVEHTLEIWATGDPDYGDEGDAAIKITDAKGQTSFDQTVHFTTHNDGSGNNNLYVWEHEKEQFTPSNPGQATVQVISIEGKASGVHIWIKDPKKTNGKRG